MTLSLALIVSALALVAASWFAWVARQNSRRIRDAAAQTAIHEAALRHAAIELGMRDAELAVAKAARQRLETTLLQANRFEQVGRLTAGLAHDLNNLLTILLAHADVLATSATSDPEMQQEIIQLQESITRAARLTGRILSFGHQESAPAPSVDIAALVRGLEGFLRKAVGAKVDLRCAIDDGAWIVDADGGQLEQVLINLATNARDAMSGGGKLQISVGGGALDAVAMRRGDDPPAGQYVEIRVQDSGPGISDDVKRRLFEPFFTTKPAGKGTGLGLSSSLGIIQRFGGRMTVDSEPGLGATFRILLPRAQSASAGHSAPRVVA